MLSTSEIPGGENPSSAPLHGAQGTLWGPDCLRSVLGTWHGTLWRTGRRIMEPLRWGKEESWEKTSKTISSSFWWITTLSARAEHWVPCPVISWTSPGVLTPKLPCAALSRAWQPFPWRNHKEDTGGEYLEQTYSSWYSAHHPPGKTGTMIQNTFSRTGCD